MSYRTNKQNYLTASQERQLSKRTKSSNRSMGNSVSSGGFFRIAFFVLFVLMFYSVATGSSQEVTFSSLLDILSGAPVIDNSWVQSFRDLSISSDWGVFNFLRDFLNTLMQIISFALYIVSGLVQVVVYFAYFIRSLFV